MDDAEPQRIHGRRRRPTRGGGTARAAAPPAAAVSDVAQRFCFVLSGRQKPELLMDVLAETHSRARSPTLIFVQTKRAADVLEACMLDNGFAVVAVHGDRTRSEREAAVASLRTGATPWAIATHGAARHFEDGPYVEHVVHYDLPDDVRTYARGIGRARHGGLATAILNLYEDCRIARSLATMLRDAAQPVPAELDQMARWAAHPQARVECVRLAGEARRQHEFEEFRHAPGNSVVGPNPYAATWEERRRWEEEEQEEEEERRREEEEEEERRREEEEEEREEEEARLRISNDID